MQLTIDRCYDVDIIKEVVFSLWDAVSEDGANKETYEPSLDDVWLEIKEEDTTLAVYQLKWWNACTLELHANILPQYRNQHTLAITNLVSDWIINNVSDEYTKLIAFIPELFPNVLDYALRSGWKLQGTLTSTYMKNGMCLDLDIVGITMKELKSLGEIKWEQQQQS